MSVSRLLDLRAVAAGVLRAPGHHGAVLQHRGEGAGRGGDLGPAAVG